MLPPSGITRRDKNAGASDEPTTEMGVFSRLVIPEGGSILLARPRRRVLAEESRHHAALDVHESALPQNVEDHGRRHALIDRVPVVAHEHRRVWIPGAEPR